MRKCAGRRRDVWRVIRIFSAKHMSENKRVFVCMLPERKLNSKQKINQPDAEHNFPLSLQ